MKQVFYVHVDDLPGRVDALDVLDELLALERLEHLVELRLDEVGLDPDVPDPRPLVAGLLDNLVDELLLGVSLKEGKSVN